MTSNFQTLYQSLKNKRLSHLIKLVASWIGKRLNETDSISRRRAYLSKKLNVEFNGVIKYGPFKGFRFVDGSWWGAADRANMLLGIYEQEVIQSLLNIPKKYRFFIDVGAADGYYGVGVIVGKLFEKSWCYEMSECGRNTIKANAELNKVANSVVIKGMADCNFSNDFSFEEASQAVLFVDVEGFEFELFNKQLFEKFRYSVIFIELHDWFFPDGNDKLRSLREDAEKFFKITTMTTSSRDMSVFDELKGMNDTDRWLICSEDRGRLMTWWRLDPL